MKFCPRCEIEKPLKDFHRHYNRHQSYCKSCMKVRNAEYWKKLGGNNEQRKEVRRKNYDKARRFVFDYLRSHPCISCGEADPVVLEFDHREREEKSRNISQLISRSASIDTLLKEIAKCDVRCANCHRRRTSEQFGWKILEYRTAQVVSEGLQNPSV